MTACIQREPVLVEKLFDIGAVECTQIDLFLQIFCKLCQLRSTRYFFRTLHAAEARLTECLLNLQQAASEWSASELQNKGAQRKALLNARPQDAPVSSGRV